MLWRRAAIDILVLVCLSAPAGTTCAQGLLQCPLLDALAGHDERAAATDSYIQTDGPSFTRANTLVPQGWTQLETRYQYTSSPTVSSFPQMDLRYGLTKQVELRAEWLGVDNGTNFRSSEDLEVGAKIAVTDGNGWVPQSALVAEVFTPTGYGANAYRQVTPELDYIYGWSLPKNLSLGGSTGAIFGQPQAPQVKQYYQSLVLGGTCLDGKLSTYYELYSLFGAGNRQGAFQPSTDLGVLYRPRHNLQLDWRVGCGLNSQATGFFTSGGVSFRY